VGAGVVALPAVYAMPAATLLAGLAFSIGFIALMRRAASCSPRASSCP
jgi:hypothetical protein